MDDSGRLDAQPDLAWALSETGKFARADRVLHEAIEIAERTADELTEARARMSLAFLRLQTDPATDHEGARAETERLIPVFERLGDDRGLAQVWWSIGKVEMWLGRCEVATEALLRSLSFAQRAGDRRARRRALVWLLLGYTFGPLPADEGMKRVEEIRRDPDAAGEVEAMALISEGAFEAMRGRFDEARQRAAAGRSQYKELGYALDWAGSSMLAGRIELIAGDPVGAERQLREGYEELERIGETGYLSTVAGLLAEAVLMQGRLDEAVRLSEVSERAAVRDDFDSQGAWRSARAEALAEQGAFAEAERLAREAVDLLDPTDFLMNRADAHTALAAVLRLAGRTDEAVTELQAAVELHELKGDVVSAGRARVLLDELAPAGLPAVDGT